MNGAQKINSKLSYAELFDFHNDFSQVAEILSNLRKAGFSRYALMRHLVMLGTKKWLKPLEVKSWH